MIIIQKQLLVLGIFFIRDGEDYLTNHNDSQQNYCTNISLKAFSDELHFFKNSITFLTIIFTFFGYFH